MIGSIDDFLIVVLIGILLFAADKNSASQSLKSLLKAYSDFRKRRDELVNELKRELNEVSTETSAPIVNVSRTVNKITATDSFSTYRMNQNNDLRVRMLEQRIKELEEEIEKLKKQIPSDKNEHPKA